MNDLGFNNQLYLSSKPCAAEVVEGLDIWGASSNIRSSAGGRTVKLGWQALSNKRAETAPLIEIGPKVLFLNSFYF